MLHNHDTGDWQPLPMVEGLASGAFEAVVGVGRMDLDDYHSHLQCDLELHPHRVSATP